MAKRISFDARVERSYKAAKAGKRHRPLFESGTDFHFGANASKPSRKRGGKGGGS